MFLQLLLQPPPPHPPVTYCTDQNRLTRSWALTSASLTWDVRPGVFCQHLVRPLSDIRLGVDLSTSFLESALVPLADNLTCDLCIQGFKNHIRNIIMQWSIVKVCNCFRDIEVSHRDLL